MGPENKDVLPLEKPGSSTSSFESSLFICKNKDSVSRNMPSHPDTKPFTEPVHASQVHGRVKDFLGVISEANKRLEVDAEENPENYDIEVLNGNESRIIEMDLMLGNTDLHTNRVGQDRDILNLGDKCNSIKNYVFDYIFLILTFLILCIFCH